MSADLPPDVRDRAAKAASDARRWELHCYRDSDDEDVEIMSGYWHPATQAQIDAALTVLLGEDVIVLSKADAAWLCDVLHGEGQTEQEYNHAHQLLEGGAR